MYLCLLQAEERRERHSGRQETSGVDGDEEEEAKPPESASKKKQAQNKLKFRFGSAQKRELLSDLEENIEFIGVENDSKDSNAYNDIFSSLPRKKIHKKRKKRKCPDSSPSEIPNINSGVQSANEGLGNNSAGEVPVEPCSLATKLEASSLAGKASMARNCSSGDNADTRTIYRSPLKRKLSCNEHSDQESNTKVSMSVVDLTSEEDEIIFPSYKKQQISKKNLNSTESKENISSAEKATKSDDVIRTAIKRNHHRPKDTRKTKQSSITSFFSNKLT